MLKTLLTEKTIRTGVTARDWQEVGRLAGQLLVDQGSVAPEYVESMFRAIQEMGMYIVIAPGIALFHGRPEDGVKEIGLSLVILKEGVNFGVPGKDPVRLAFALAATDNESHLGLLASLMDILQDSDAVKTLIGAATPQEVVKIICQRKN